MRHVISEFTETILVEPQQEQEVEVTKYIRDILRLSVTSLPELDELRPRIFHMLGGSLILGLHFTETPDSFLVGLPAILSDVPGGGVSVTSLTRSKVIRLNKTSYSFVDFMDNKTLKWYYTYLSKVPSEYLDVINPLRMERIKAFLETKTSNSRSPVKSEKTEKPDEKTFESLQFHPRYYSKDRH